MTKAALLPKELLIVTLLSLAFGAYYAVHAGQDTNWDWANYHDYDVLALLNMRGAIDVAPAGIQTFLNPIPYLPLYLLRHTLPPMLGGAIVGTIQALNFPIVWILMRRLIPDLSWFAMVAAMIISASGAMTLSEIGTSFADLLTAIPVLVGLVLLLPYGVQRWSTVFIAGAFIGSAVGLKLTNATFAVGAAAMILCGERPLRLALCFGLGGAAGVGLCGGAWSFYLWQEFQNPFFPFYNKIFHSPAGPSWNAPRTVPYRFPHGIIDALSYPFRWILAGRTTAEATFRDARFAAIMVLLGINLGVAAVQRRRLLSNRETQFAVFFVVSFSISMFMFSAQRFLIALEMLAGPMIVMLIWHSIPVPGRNIAAGVAAVALALWVKPSDWGHRPWTNVYNRSPVTGELRKPATYFLVEKPLAFVIRSFPADSRFYQLSDGELPIVKGAQLDNRIRAGLANPLPGGNWVIRTRGDSIPTDLLKPYRLEADDLRSCITLPGISVDLDVCPLRPSRNEAPH